MKDKTLVIMAAGMGSRFGGLKQIEPMGPNGEFLIDYSIYDAIKVGFNKVVFIIKEENFDIFKETIGSRVDGKIKVEYVFQKLGDEINKYDILKTRVKPLGTSHAILCCKDTVKEPFVIINADDFYGYDAYLKASQFLDNCNDYDYGVIGYEVSNTLSPNGSVKRAVCLNDNGELIDLIESSIERKDGKIIASPLDSSDEIIMKEDDSVSMNMLLFTPTIFNYLEKEYEQFLNTANLEKDEFLIPTSLKNTKKEGISNVSVLKTSAMWHGVTYKEDTENVKNEISLLVNKNEYPLDLWK